MALSIVAPVAYIATLFLALALFSRVYRRRSLARVQAYQRASADDAQLQPARAIYRTLAAVQETYPEAPADAPEWVVPRATLQSALLDRAVVALRRMTDLRRDKHALSTLLENGSLGDDAATMLEAMETDVRAEIMEIVREAGRFNPSWSKIIFESAGEISANMRCRDVLLGVGQQREDEAAKTRQLGLAVPAPLK
ncbi:Translocation protein S66 [Malassezia sp. CBS 17886]|nr:Translocation protein S66 [Malassezia sp. CBS 17886]